MSLVLKRSKIQFHSTFPCPRCLFRAVGLIPLLRCLLLKRLICSRLIIAINPKSFIWAKCFIFPYIQGLSPFLSLSSCIEFPDQSWLFPISEGRPLGTFVIFWEAHGLFSLTSRVIFSARHFVWWFRVVFDRNEFCSRWRLCWSFWEGFWTQTVFNH